MPADDRATAAETTLADLDVVEQSCSPLSAYWFVNTLRWVDDAFASDAASDRSVEAVVDRVADRAAPVRDALADGARAVVDAPGTPTDWLDVEFGDGGVDGRVVADDAPVESYLQYYLARRAIEVCADCGDRQLSPAGRAALDDLSDLVSGADVGATDFDDAVTETEAVLDAVAALDSGLGARTLGEVLDEAVAATVSASDPDRCVEDGGHRVHGERGASR